MLLTFFVVVNIKWSRRLELSGFDSVILRHILRSPKFLRIFMTGGRANLMRRLEKLWGSLGQPTVNCISDEYLGKMERIKRTYISSRIFFCYFRLQEMS